MDGKTKPMPIMDSDITNASTIKPMVVGSLSSRMLTKEKKAARLISIVDNSRIFMFMVFCLKLGKNYGTINRLMYFPIKSNSRLTGVPFLKR